MYCENGKDLLGRGPPLKSIMSDFTIIYCMYDLHDPVTICVTISFFLFLFYYCIGFLWESL